MPYVELPPDVEAEMREEALRQNVGLETFASNYMARSWRGRRRATKKVTPPDILTAEERRTLDDLDAELAREFWLRYNAHFDKLDAARRGKAVYTEEDEAVGLRYVEQIAEIDIKRLQVVVQMAERRGVNPAEFWKRLSLGHHPDATVGRKRL